MAISLEELKQQREQIQKHLEWLDVKISELSDETDAIAPEKNAPERLLVHNQQAQANPLPPTSDKTTSEQAPESTAPTRPLEAKSDSLDIHSDYKPKTQSEVQRAKIGCLAFFILATALFLFLLFGLPYLL